MISFEGFVDFVDHVGGIEIDVPTALRDPYYPDGNDGYTVFEVNAGVQTMDGETALKYARSRKTTSDFSRALRQQQVIESLIKQMIGSVGLTNIGKIKELFAEFDKIVDTNVTVKQIL